MAAQEAPPVIIIIGGPRPSSTKQGERWFATRKEAIDFLKSQKGE